MAGLQEDAVNRTSSLGWIYVVISDTRSAGPRQAVPSWLPGGVVAVYAAVLTVAAVLLNAAVLGGSLTAAARGRRGGAPVPAVRRLLTVNLAAVHLIAATLVVPAGAATEAVGRWSLGGRACRAWLIAQVHSFTD